MPLQATSGAASYDAFGGGVPVVPNYIEDVFSTYLYTGNGSTQTITNGIDLSTKGGLVWTKARTTTSAFSFAHALIDTVRGAGIQVVSNGTSGNATQADSLTAFNSNGYTLGADTGQGRVNNTSYGTQTYVSWTFREQAKFFDVVTYTGTGSLRTVSHNLGSTPGCILIKNLSDSDRWAVYHQSLGATQTLCLNETTAAVTDGNTNFNNTAPTSTEFTVNTTARTNQAGNNYVAYLFAHDAGGFGLTGTDNVISCGTYTGNGSASGPTITLGYEPQWVLVKRTDSTSNWTLSDNMRGQPVDGATAILYPNASDAEASATTAVSPTATGFQVKTAGATYNASGATYIYIAIRRGPMKVPTSGTSVFSPLSVTPVSGPTTTFTTNFPVDLLISKNRQYESNNLVQDRLRGGSVNVITNGTRAEESGSGVLFDSNVKAVSTEWGTGFGPIIGWNFRRAPSFFDEVCYTGTGSVTTQAHNLGVAPELLIVKRRNAANYAPVWNKSIGNDYILKLFDAQATSDDPKDGPTDVQFNQTAPTASVFTLGTSSSTNGSGSTYVAWMWATCAGVSKVGSYTGTGTTLQVDCGFAGGARFVLIKRTDSTGDWYVWDSARGIVSGNDPYSLLNSDVAEVTNTDYVDTYSAGFEISSTAPAAINASGGTFVFLAIAQT